MTAGLLRNIYLNVSAFTINALVGLAVVPLLIHAYGLAGYGLIVLARQVLPVGALGLFEAGVPEATSRYVASSIAERNGKLAGQCISVSTVIAATTGIILLIILFAVKAPLVRLLSVPTSYMDGFEYILEISAFSLPLFFCGSVWRGALEGLDRFAWVRMVEVGGTVSFALLVIIFPLYGFGLETVAVGFVLIGNARSIIYFIMIVALRARLTKVFLQIDFREVRPMLLHARSFFMGKIYTAFLTHIPVVLVAIMSNVSMVGGYDAVMRIPRLLKTASGMFGNVLLPHSARVEVLNEGESARNLIDIGTILVMALVSPVAITFMICAEEVVHVWLDPKYAELVPWFGLAMIWPILLSTAGIGTSMVLARHHAVKAMNKISLVNIIVFFGLSVALTPLIGWGAFIVALIVASVITIPLQHLLVKQEYKINYIPLRTFLTRLMMIGAGVYALKVVLVKYLPQDSPVMQIAFIFTTLALMYTGVYFFALAMRERKMFVEWVLGLLNK